MLERPRSVCTERHGMWRRVVRYVVETGRAPHHAAWDAPEIGLGAISELNPGSNPKAVA